MRTTQFLGLSLASFLLASACLAADVDVYTTKQLQSLGEIKPAKGAAYADHNLARYGNHYLLFIRRDETGSSELHEHEADVFVVESGTAIMISGGKLVGGHPTKPGEIRGTSISGGKRQTLAAGDVVHISAGVAHQLLIDKAQPFTYFVVKVSGQ